jgi:hypothetical protein
MHTYKATDFHPISSPTPSGFTIASTSAIVISKISRLNEALSLNESQFASCASYSALYIHPEVAAPPLRYLLAAHPQAMSKVLGIVYRAISTHLIHKAGYQLKDGATGAVTPARPG